MTGKPPKVQPISFRKDYGEARIMVGPNLYIREVDTPKDEYDEIDRLARLGRHGAALKKMRRLKFKKV